MENSEQNNTQKEVDYISEVIEDNYTEGVKSEDIPQSSKSIVFMLLKQIRIGMDLSRIVLPTFILEPRSMLEKLSDFLTHAELLALVSKIEDPMDRLVALVKWYLSGFYVKPKGVKKPYNPILGEFFRCQWQHHNKSKTLFVAEQVSHHPPVSAFYASNRQEGYVVNGSILFRTKFLGTSAASILDGFLTLTIIPFDEEYEITFPSAYVKGFLFGTLSMELVGTVAVRCRKTGCTAEIEFKSKPMFGGGYNQIQGKITQGEELVYTIQGKWDGKIDLMKVNDTNTESPKLRSSSEGTVLWQPTAEIRQQKLARMKPVYDQMQDFESDKLWKKVGDAIRNDQQEVATEEKAVLEHNQRTEAKHRAENKEKWHPKYFVKNAEGIWTYKYFNKSPWDPSTEIEEFELDGVIQSRKK